MDRALVATIALALGSDFALARKTNQAVYQEPFDVAAGGASLTRGSQEGAMFGNPAVMAYGRKFHRWFGTQTALITSPDSVDMVRDLATGSGNDSTDSEDTADDGSSQPGLVERVFTTPIHFGVQNATSYISEAFGLGAFARFEPDIKGQKHNQTGIPELRARADLYYGGIFSVSENFGWLSLGVSTRYMYKSEPDIAIDLADQNLIEDLQNNPQSLQNQAEPGQGMGIDIGSLVFLQGNHVDFRFATKVDDLGNTQYSGAQTPHLQTVHAGLGLTFHNSVDSIHASVDYRDILNAYQEPTYMKLYAGLRFILRNYVGLGVGYYQGYPSIGIRLDLILLQVGFTSYTREMGTYLGEDPRQIYMAYFGLGF